MEDVKRILNNSIIVLSLIFIITMSYYNYKYINFGLTGVGIVITLTFLAITPLKNLYSKYKYTYKSIWYYIITFIYLGYCNYNSIDTLVKRYLDPDNVFIRPNILFLLITLLIIIILSLILKKDKELNKISNRKNYILIMVISGIYIIAFYSQNLFLSLHDVSFLIIFGTSLILSLSENYDIEYKTLFWIYVALIILSIYSGSPAIAILILSAFTKLDGIAKIGIKK